MDRTGNVQPLRPPRLASVLYQAGLQLSQGWSVEGERRACSMADTDFITTHELWDEERRDSAARIPAELESIEFVRVVVADLHGLARSKTFTRRAFLRVLRDGARFSSSVFLLDTGGNVAIDYLDEGAGVEIEELRGAGNFVAVPDPLTFRVLPWTCRPCGWVIADEYLRSGAPHPLSPRKLLQALQCEVARRGWRHNVGLELEWHLTRYAHPFGSGEMEPGHESAPPTVVAVDNARQLNLEGLTDALATVLDPLTSALLQLGLPLRTIEHESGPGQLEFTFDAMDGLDAADAAMLVRVAAKQVCQRLGHHATFMALPKFEGLNANGWHLHQSLGLPGGTSLFQPDEPSEPLSEIGRRFVAGLLRYAAEGTIFATPTVNGYRRFDDRFPFAPTRVNWSTEHRGALVRVAGGADDPETHVESRLGEPCANPYLYLSSQLSAGLAGIDAGLDPGEALRASPVDDAPRLPRSLRAALDAFVKGEHYTQLLGSSLTACWTQVKMNELRRFEAWRSKHGDTETDVSDWEHLEYFQRF